MTLMCDFCTNNVVGEIEYTDGEVVMGCADCLLEIVADPSKPIEKITEYES